jgi:hypothetical protein
MGCKGIVDRMPQVSVLESTTRFHSFDGRLLKNAGVSALSDPRRYRFVFGVVRRIGLSVISVSDPVCKGGVVY